MQHEPLRAMELLYAQLGDDLTDDTRRRMHDWWAEAAEDRRRGARRDPATFGLDADQIAEEFDFYHDYFGIGRSEKGTGR